MFWPEIKLSKEDSHLITVPVKLLIVSVVVPTPAHTLVPPPEIPEVGAPLT